MYIYMYTHTSMQIYLCTYILRTYSHRVEFSLKRSVIGNPHPTVFWDGLPVVHSFASLPLQGWLPMAYRVHCSVTFFGWPATV